MQRHSMHSDRKNYCYIDHTNQSNIQKYLGFPWWLSDKESADNAGDPGSIPRLEDPWRRAWQPTPVLLPREFHGQRIPWTEEPVRLQSMGCTELDTTEWLSSTIKLSMVFLSQN